MGIKVEVPPERVRKMILAAYRASFSDPSASADRARFVAGRVGISVPKLYEQVRELGLEETIRGMREKSGLSSSGRSPGAKYKCSGCGKRGHNSRSCPGSP